MKKRCSVLKLFIIVFLLLILNSSCYPYIQSFQQTTKFNVKKDLVFVSDFAIGENKKFQTDLSFLNINRVEISTEVLDRKFIALSKSGQEDILFGITDRSFLSSGYPAYMDRSTGFLTVCYPDFPKMTGIHSTMNPENQFEVVLFEPLQIIVFDMSTCNTVEEVIDNSQYPGAEMIYGVSPNIDQETILYGFASVSAENKPVLEIIEINTNTKGERIIAEGIQPSWNPDYSGFAFLQSDGVYFYHVQNGNIEKILNKTFFKSADIFDSLLNVPSLSWSQDGRYLFYEYLINDEYPLRVDSYSVYMLNIETSEETQISPNGRFPCWLGDNQE